MTLDTRGELSLISVWLLDESIEATNDPESEEVTKKVRYSKKSGEVLD